MKHEKIRLGELLIQHQLINEEQLAIAITTQRNEGGKLGTILVNLGYIEKSHLYCLLSQQLQLPYIELKHYDFKPELIRQLPENYARRFRALVLADNGNALVLGMVDPQDIFAYDQLTRLIKRPLELALVDEIELLAALDLVYRRTEEIATFAKELSAEITESDYDINQLATEPSGKEAPVVRLLQSLFEDAVQVRASDIHIEPDEQVLRIRQRIDGVLQEHIMPEPKIAAPLTQRLKLMAKLNITERRLPQDGRFSIKVHGRYLDVRLSTMPIQYGESVVMRLLEQNNQALKLEQLGMPPAMLRSLQRLMHMPHGMLLVTGPTGSGKTTTLYSILNQLNTASAKIITVEDPVEYRLPRINQVQVNPKVNLSFSKVLRAALRQDPDILMVGEIRDNETASIALKAAMTGHLVLATLHTNDAISSVMRLMEMQSESYLVAAALRAIIAQRLIRRICTHCSQDYQPSAAEIVWLKGLAKDHHLFHQGSGCSHCNHTGYKGRIGIYELLELDVTMLEALRDNDLNRFNQAAYASKLQLLWQSALDLAIQGITSLAEVLRVSASLDDALLLAEEESSIEAAVTANANTAANSSATAATANAAATTTAKTNPTATPTPTTSNLLAE